MRLPTIEIDEELYCFIKLMKDRGGYKSLADLVRMSLRQFCAPHLLEAIPVVKPPRWVHWPIVDKPWSCGECRTGKHCGGGITHDANGEFVTPEPDLNVQHRWVCICPQCCEHEISYDLTAITILRSFPETPREVPIVGYRPRRRGDPESWNPNITEPVGAVKPPEIPWLDQKKELAKPAQASLAAMLSGRASVISGPKLGTGFDADANAGNPMMDFPMPDESLTNWDERTNDHSRRIREWKIATGQPLDPKAEALAQRKAEIMRNARVEP